MKLDNRIAELIAVGASITANCQPCLQYHVKKALESGANEQEIADAIEIGRMVRKGASSKMDKFAAGLNEVVPVGAGEAEEGCGCGS
ncbi:MAG: carboxymuconolactone decarboxylase family protein [Chloroflexi bacterium]|nr:carboxymuconolactone decarboxylase family protein [Chloroflexota bacterium]